MGARWAALVAVAFTAWCAAAVGAAPASASTIYTRASGCNPGPCTDSDYVYAGSGSEWNNVLVTQSGGNYDFLEMAPSTTITFPDPRCTQVSSQEVTCPIVPDSDGLTWDADAELHGGDDQIDMRTTRPSRIEGGGGSDVLKGSSSDDVIAGDEDFPSPPPPDGNDFIDGRGGADHMVGDGGTDTVSYISRSTPVNASLDGVANDGGSGEGDNIEGDVEILSGSQGNDTLTGNGGPNTLLGNSGNNDLNGLDGDDTLQGGDGIDTLDGGAGADDETGGAGIDIADYTAATVPLSVNAFDDQPNDGAAGEGDNVHSDIEVIEGGQSNDDLTPPDNGSVYGGNGNDTLHGGGQVGNDTLDGGPGNDTLDGGWGADILHGGPDIDTVDYTDHFFVDDFGQAFGVNSVPDGVDNDGNGEIDANFGGPGPSHDNVEADIENVIGSGGPDNLVGTDDSNLLQGGADNDALFGGLGNDDLQGGPGVDTFEGGAGDDTLDGATGADSFSAGPGDDLLDGGNGADTLNGQGGVDTITYEARTKPVAVTLDSKRNDGADPDQNGKSSNTEEGDLDRSIENAIGGDGADILRATTATSVVNVLRGNRGDDTLNAREGTTTVDQLLCGPGSGDRFAKDPSDTRNACEVALP